MDAHELMLSRSQYICVLVLVNARFSILKKKQKPKKRRTKRFWIREYLKKREKYGQFHILFSELSLSDREYFFRYIQDESKMLWRFAPYIQKEACRSRDPISPAERLVVTLRYLASWQFQISVFQLPYREEHRFRVLEWRLVYFWSGDWSPAI